MVSKNLRLVEQGGHLLGNKPLPGFPTTNSFLPTTAHEKKPPVKSQW